MNSRLRVLEKTVKPAQTSAPAEFSPARLVAKMNAACGDETLPENERRCFVTLRTALERIANEHAT